MAAQDWASIKQTVAIALTQVQSPYTSFPDNFEAQFPLAISWAEDRIFRASPLLAMRSVNTSLSTTNGSRTISLSSINPPVVLVEDVMLTAPSGDLVLYDRVDLDYLRAVWPNPAMTMAASPSWQGGRYWAMQDQQTIALAPTPNATYTVNLAILSQPVGLSVGNTSTYLSTTYPDALIAGAMVYMTGALTRNFGAQADEPRSAVSWQQQFENWLAVIRDEERRRRGLAPDMPQPPAQEMARQAQ